MLNIGIASMWHVHAEGYAKELIETGKVKITAVWDELPERGRKAAERFGARFVDDYDEFIASSDFEGIMCCAPTTMHLDVITKAVKAGKHVFTEKLLVPEGKACLELCELIEKSGIVFTISLPLRCDSKMLYAKKLIEDGTLGRVTGARMRRSHSGVSDNWLPDYWYDVSKTGGGSMMDLGCHPVYMLSYLFGAPVRVSGISTNIYGTTSDENAIAVVEFADGVIGTCETAFVTNCVPDILEVYGTEGALFIHGNEVHLSTKTLTALGIPSAVPVNLPRALPDPLTQYVDACINGTGTPKYLGPRDALIMTNIIEAFYTSDRDNKTVTF